MARYKITVTTKETATVDIGDLPPGFAEEVLDMLADPEATETSYSMADLNTESEVTSIEVKPL